MRRNHMNPARNGANNIQRKSVSYCTKYQTGWEGLIIWISFYDVTIVNSFLYFGQRDFPLSHSLEGMCRHFPAFLFPQFPNSFNIHKVLYFNSLTAFSRRFMPSSMIFMLVA